MTTNYHTPIQQGAPANSSTFNEPLEELDQALSSSQVEERGGHVIKHNNESLPQRAILNFAGDVDVEDDPDTDATIVWFGGGIDEAYKNLSLFCDFFGSPSEFGVNAPLEPWQPLQSGTLEILSGEAGHAGIHRVSSHASNTNSGARAYIYELNAVLVQENFIFEVIFRCPTVTDLAHKIGFFDTTNVTAGVVDGVWISIDGVVLRGRTSNNSSASQTTSNYNITANQWYRAKIVVNGDASRVDFYLYDDWGGLLFYDELASNIPTGAGRECTMQVMAGKTSAGSAAILDVDWLGFYTVGGLNR